jgi:hypothetical protein
MSGKKSFFESERFRRIWIALLGERPVRPYEMILLPLWWGGTIVSAYYYWFHVRPLKQKHEEEKQK